MKIKLADGTLLDVDMTACVSKVIDTYGYDEATSTLYIRFQHGKKLYAYSGFPADMHNSMREAVSAGKYFQQHIVKNYHGNYINEAE